MKYRSIIAAMFMLTAICACISVMGCCGNTCENNSSYTKISDNFMPEPQIEFAPKQYVCYRSSGEINIDGRLNDKSWAKAQWTDFFIDIEGRDKPEPRFKTRVKMLWDDEYFYFAGDMEEPDVWGKLTDRDAVIFYDNDFEVFIDPDGDTHEYYELEVNALGTEWDLFLVKPYRDGGPAVDAWDIQGLKTAVFVDGSVNKPGDVDRGWSIEIAIPWDVLKQCAHKDTPPKDGDQWRVNFSRVEWQTEVKKGEYLKLTDPETGKNLPEANWVWSPQGLINMHYPEMWGFVQFADKPAGEESIDFAFNPEELARWALRRLYYKQRTHMMQYGRYTADIERLEPGNIKPAGYSWPPQITTGSEMFEAYIENRDNGSKLYISQDGRIWRRGK